MTVPKYRVKFGKKYKKDIKRLMKSHVDLAALEKVIDLLQRDVKLVAKFQDHELKGKLKGTRECHIGPDWLLQYAKDEEYLYLMLISTGSHRRVLGIE